MLDLVTEVSKYWMEGAVRTLEGWQRGFYDEYPVDQDPPATTPYEVVYEGGKTRLRHYPAQGKTLHTPLLLVYSLIKRPFILDLLPGRSVIESLTKHGVDVYFIDWIPPTRSDSWRGFDAYVEGDLANTVRVVQERQRVERVSLLGYCFGGLLTTIYTALHQDAVQNLVNFTLPLDMGANALPSQALLKNIPPATTDLILSVYGNCPPWLIKSGFDAMSPVHQGLDKYVGLYRGRDNEAYVEMFELFERWMNSDVPMAGRIFKETMEDVFGWNRVARNEFRVGARVVDLQAITCPVLNVIGEHDDVVHPSASTPLVDLVASDDANNLVFPTGHIGAAVSSAAHKQLWPQVAGWLQHRDGRWEH